MYAHVLVRWGGCGSGCALPPILTPSFLLSTPIPTPHPSSHLLPPLSTHPLTSYPHCSPILPTPTPTPSSRPFKSFLVSSQLAQRASSQLACSLLLPLNDTHAACSLTHMRRPSCEAGIFVPTSSDTYRLLHTL